MSAYPQGDPHWDDDQYILWNTGKVYSGDSTFETPYGGGRWQAGTYYWRARVWDNQQSASAYTYASIVSRRASSPTRPTRRRRSSCGPGLRGASSSRTCTSRTASPARPGARPGRIVAILEDAKNVGASLLYNSPGELHFTLAKDHPQLSVIEPKQTHYSVQFRTGDGWREVFAGLMWDFDATDTDVVFYGIDYLALLDYVMDERFDSSNPDKAAENWAARST
jgi:hypothetical protein